MKAMPQAGPKSLKEIQSLMLEAVRRPLTEDESIQPVWSDGRSAEQVASQIIRPNERLTASARLEIYNQQYWWRLTASLHEDFRGLRAVIGEEPFEKLIVAYLETHPSRSWTMRNLGSQMPEFVANRPDLIGEPFDLAKDIAVMEWARVVAFDDPVWPVLDASELATRAADHQPIYLQPYIQLLTVQHPVDKLMLRLKKRDQQTASNTAAARQQHRFRPLTAQPLVKPLHLAVHRCNFVLYYKRLTPESMKLLRALQAGQGIEQACATAFEGSKIRPSQQASRVQTWFAGWMELGWFCDPPKE
jgi:Putative DNA-binding domain